MAGPLLSLLDRLAELEVVLFPDCSVRPKMLPKNELRFLLLPTESEEVVRR